MIINKEAVRRFSSPPDHVIALSHKNHFEAVLGGFFLSENCLCGTHNQISIKLLL